MSDSNLALSRPGQFLPIIDLKNETASLSSISYKRHATATRICNCSDRLIELSIELSSVLLSSGTVEALLVKITALILATSELFRSMMAFESCFNNEAGVDS